MHRHQVAVRIAKSVARKSDLPLDEEERYSATLLGAALALRWAEGKGLGDGQFVIACKTFCRRELWAAMRIWSKCARPIEGLIDDPPSYSMTELIAAKAVVSTMPSLQQIRIGRLAAGWTYAEIANAEERDSGNLYVSLKRAIAAARKVAGYG